MSAQLPRRQFLQAASALGLGASLAPWDSISAITPASADEAKVGPEMVRLRPEIEPVFSGEPVSVRVGVTMLYHLGPARRAGREIEERRLLRPHPCRREMVGRRL